ncbi:MAG: two-component sensor histidine kinase, partial [Alphaproteobacteria bacterium]|nr:two-component sensor histidine kinase [Alphaproteobacteria bacterium]
TGGMKKLAAGAAKQEAMRAAGVMAAMLAHEVKNPLSGIRGAAQLLREEIAPEQQTLTDLIASEVERITSLLNQVEIFSDGAPSERSAVNIHEVLQYVISVARAGFAAHVKFVEKYDPSLPPVLSQRDYLVQLFLNLVKNAAEATAGSENATITLSTSYRSGYRLGNVALPIAVSVEDNGPGIPESVRARVFEPLISSKEEGRGLGLAVVAKLTADLGAMVELDEEKPDGARFIVMLPVAV